MVQPAGKKVILKPYSQRLCVDICNKMKILCSEQLYTKMLIYAWHLSPLIATTYDDFCSPPIPFLISV